MTVGFRPLAEPDLRLLYEWLQREHVKRWWNDRETFAEVVEHYLPSIEGRDPTNLYLIVDDDEPAGFIQTYAVAGYPEYRDLVGVEDGVAGVDLFIAQEERTGRGLGSEALRLFVEEIVFSEPGTHACIADPDAENVASLRAFEKAGFAAAGEFVDPSDGRVHTLMRRDC
jgi:RimJ/RimL family protein N-acetyltransferase